MNTISAIQLKQWAVSINKESVTPELAIKLKDHSANALRLEKKIDAYTFKYKSNGVKVSGFLVAPKQCDKKLPVIIYNRGGTADFGLIRKGHLFTKLAKLAEYGYIVIGSQYPGNITSEGLDERGEQSDIDSILELYRLIEVLDYADLTRIGMYGESRGGMMTYLCMAQVDWIKAALTIGGLANLDRTLIYRPEMARVYNTHFNNTVAARRMRSAVHWVDTFNKTTPLCLLHGNADDQVNVRDAYELAEALENANHPYALHIIQDGNHGLVNAKDERDSIIRLWFEKHLKDPA